MSVANEIQRLQQAKADLKTAIEAKGVTVPSSALIDDYPNLVNEIEQGGGGLPTVLEVESTTVHTTGPDRTQNIASNDHLRILGSDNKRYTIAQWDALWVAAGYNKDNMQVTPKGISLDAFDRAGECLIFQSPPPIYNAHGVNASGNGCLYYGGQGYLSVGGAASGTDYTTRKVWSVTADGDNLVLYEANTKCSWTIAKGCGQTTAVTHDTWNLVERNEAYWAQNEWMRHRMAISSGVPTTKVDGTMGDIEIYNSSGVQASVGEDMYFWIKNDSNAWVNTNLLAKYNLSNIHNTNSAYLTQTISDAIYASQKSQGVNMNDTGVNSSSKHLLLEGMKGAEAIAVEGYWFIITPYISNPHTNQLNYNNTCDVPPVYWTRHLGYTLPSYSILYASGQNRTLVISLVVNYLKNIQHWDVEYSTTGNAWTGSQYSNANNVIVVERGQGFIQGLNASSNSIAAVPSLYLPESNS